METSECAALKNHRERLCLVEACPPDFLVRGAVLNTDELILSHIAKCRRCSGIYMAALGSDWHPKHRRLEASSMPKIDIGVSEASWRPRGQQQLRLL